jgi:hypothetical protein
MPEQLSDDRRLDLTALDVNADPLRDEAVIAAVMRRVGGSAPPHARAEDITRLLRLRRYLVALAAVLAAIAAMSLFSARRTGDHSAADVIASWAESRHVPTNGELLALYKGYRP